VLYFESDHFDCFSDLDDAHNAFREFAARVDLAGLLLLNGDCPNTLQLAEHTDARVETFGFSTTNHWSIQQTHDSSPDRSERKRQANDRLTVLRQGGHFCDVSLSVAGEHNAFNALAAIALAAHAGVSAGQISAAISQFRGVRRRFELVGSRDGVTVISDYAHHPTAIRATIETARSIYPERRIVCLFEPHQISRTVSLLDDFVDSLSLADDVTLGPIFTARENSDGAIEAQLLLLQGLERQNTSARAIASLDQAVSTLDDVVECGDVLLIMGAGNVESIPKQFLANFDHLYSKQTS
jgi:UDP-N-acetylmuramate--alanine ligase